MSTKITPQQRMQNMHQQLQQAQSAQGQANWNNQQLFDAYAMQKQGINATQGISPWYGVVKEMEMMHEAYEKKVITILSTALTGAAESRDTFDVRGVLVEISVYSPSKVTDRSLVEALVANKWPLNIEVSVDYEDPGQYETYSFSTNHHVADGLGNDPEARVQALVKWVNMAVDAANSLRELHGV